MYVHWQKTMRRGSKMLSICKPRWDVSKGANPTGTLILDFQPSKLWDHKYLYAKPPSLWYFVRVAMVKYHNSPHNTEEVKQVWRTNYLTSRHTLRLQQEGQCGIGERMGKQIHGTKQKAPKSINMSIVNWSLTEEQRELSGENTGAPTNGTGKTRHPDAKR